MANSIQYDYKILDRYTAPLAKIRQATEKMRGAVQKASKQVDKLGNKFKETGSKMTNAQSAIAGVGAALAIKSLVDNSLEMSDAMADVEKVSDLTGKTLKKLRFNLEDLSEQVGRPAAGLAQIAFEGKKLGATDKEILPFVKTVGKMAIAFEIAESEAGNAIGQIRAKLGYGMGDIIKFGDSSNELANRMATNGKNIVEITQRMSGTFKTLEFPPSIAAGFAATADMLETSPELAASGMNMMMRKLSLIPGMTSKLMAAPVQTINEVMSKLAKLPVEKRIKKINKLFGAEAGRMVLKMTGNLDLFNKAMKTATDTTAVGSMDREMSNYLNRSSTKMKIANEKIRNSFRRLGDVLVPFVILFGNLSAKFSKWSVKMSMAHPLLMKVATAALLLIAVFTILLIPLGFIASGFGVVLSILPMLASAFGILSGAVLAITGFMTPLIASAWAFTAALLANPITWLVAGIIAAIAAVTRLIVIWDKLKTAFSEGGMMNAIKTFFGMSADDTEITSKKVVAGSVDVKSQSKQSVDVGGLIKVAAEKGSKVLSATPNFNTGQNMEFSH